MAQPFKDNIKPTNFIWHGQWNPPEDEVAYANYYSISEIDLLSLDAEGHEIQILEGMIGSRVLPEVVCVEYPISGLDNIKSIMSEFGYNFNFVSFNNAFFSFIDKETWFGATERMPDYDISI